MNAELVKIIIEGFQLIYKVLAAMATYLGEKHNDQHADFFPVKDRLEELRSFVEDGPDFSGEDE